MRRAFLLTTVLLTTPLIAAELPFYIGTYTRAGGSEGIYRGVLDTAKGTAKITGLAGKAKNPSFLAIHPSGQFLYAAIEDGGGAAGAFAIEADGTLRHLGNESTKGSGNCHVWVDPSGRVLLAANYGSGNVAAFPIRPDGSIAPASDTEQHSGSGPNAGRQKGPHAHAIVVRGDFAYACDLGTDDVFIYKLDAEKGTLTPANPPFAEVPPGGGPRHISFHPKADFAYVNNELTSTISAFAHDPKTGALTLLHTLSTLPEGTDAAAIKNSTAEIHVHPSGKTVYVSNRGHDSIAAYTIGADGKLTLLQIAEAKVKVPRGFGISPDGGWLIAAGQNSNDLALHAIAADGKLTFQSMVGSIGAPVNVEFIPKKNP